MPAYEPIPRTAYEANERLGMRRSVLVASGTRLVREMDGRVSMTYNGRTCVAWAQNGYITLFAPPRTRPGHTAVMRRMQAVLPLDWTLQRVGPNRRWRLMYRDAYPVTMTGLIILMPNGVESDGYFMSRSELDAEVAERTNTAYEPGPTPDAWDPDGYEPDEPEPEDEFVRTWRDARPQDAPPLCECTRDGRALAGDDVTHGEFFCFRTPTFEESQASWERAQSWLPEAVANFRARHPEMQAGSFIVHPDALLRQCNEGACRYTARRECDGGYCEVHCACDSNRVEPAEEMML
jgi:hypothetical protein